MKAKRFYHSLRFKITAGIAVTLLIVLSLFSYLQYQRSRAAMMDSLALSAAHASDVIKSSLQHAMLTQDFSEVQQIVDQIARQSGIRNLLLLNKKGEIKFSPEGGLTGVKLDPSEPTCQVCHQYQAEVRKRTVVLTTREGERIFRTMNPIENKPECYACHDPETRINGLLFTDLSLAEIDKRLAADVRNNILWSATTILVIIGALNFMMNRLVVTRLERFVDAIQRFGKGDLEQRVAMRSQDEIGELADSFNLMADGLQEKETENARLYAELQQKEALRGQLLEKVIAAQEDERKRIARELHDEYAQTLTALTMSVEAAERILPPDMTKVREQLDITRSLTVQALDQTYNLILDLRPTVLDDLGLVPAIRWYGETHVEPMGIHMELQASGIQARLPAEIETALFRVIQEALNNVVKHAGARHVSIRLELKDSLLTGLVEDDGQGFDIGAVWRSRDKTRGLGLLGMQERVALFGGTFAIESQPGRGTRLAVEIPLAEGSGQL
jgi:signal transduction histidine kinase